MLLATCHGHDLAMRHLTTAGPQPDLSHCLNDLPWEGWPYDEAPPDSSSTEDVVSAALRLMASSSIMSDGSKAEASLTRFSRCAQLRCWLLIWVELAPARHSTRVHHALDTQAVQAVL
jgi:hypothetical protein